MAKKEFTFRGKTIEELNALNKEQFAELLTSRARRSLLRQDMSHVLKKLLKARKVKEEGKYPRPIRTHRRDLVVVPEMVGLEMAVYNGKEFQKIGILPEMLGHFLGELALSRKRIKHGKAGIGATRSSTAKASKK